MPKVNLPEGMMSMKEFADAVGVSYQVIVKLGKFDHFPLHRLGPKKFGVIFDDACQAPAILNYKAGRGLPPPPKDLEETLQMPRAAAPAETFEPLYSESAAPASRALVAIQPAPMAMAAPEKPAAAELEKAPDAPTRPEGLEAALRARNTVSIAASYVRAAAKSRDKGERQAERVLLWLAIEELGFLIPETTPQAEVS